ncbi:MAG: hypothetical protein JSU61_12030 [Fidelibacterota bacterium]|nr:MAG: hypothetical protein JSU61_12030 [Candidatus Neomarinimicrobiota bacterium]
MLEIIYILITGAFLALTVADLFAERNWKRQITHLIVMIPLILRVLQIK